VNLFSFNERMNETHGDVKSAESEKWFNVARRKMAEKPPALLADRDPVRWKAAPFDGSKN
jgi:hypothetical protein